MFASLGISRRLTIRFWLVVLAQFAGASCGNHPAQPTVSAVAITCPAPITAASADGGPVVVTYSAPVVSGGQAPVTTACTSASGSAFPLGTTTVTCTATDAQRRVASCSLPVTVQRVPRLGVSRIVAFGDSITEGVVSTCNRITPFMTFRESLLQMPTAADAAWSYPNLLQGLLRGYFPAESTVVINRGRAGEEVASGQGRLPTELMNHTPEVLLLQEGANDVVQGHSPGAIAGSLRGMVQLARMRNTMVFLGTVLPEKASPCRAYLTPAAVPPVNDAIRALAASENVPLVDLYAAFGDPPGDLIGPDGLHPTDAGYRLIAETFFNAIQQRLQR
jgi:lysophospholipase L1-like esterase